MTRNLKALGLALFAVFALGAMTASAASASVSIFDSEVTPTGLTGTSDESAGTSTGTQVFKSSANGPEIICHHVAFKGTQTGTSVSTIEIQAEYTTPTCTGPLGSEVHVDFTTGGCGYHFTGTASLTATAKLVCSVGGGSVTLTPTLFGSSICTIHIPPQTVGGDVKFHNVTINGKKSVTAEANNKEISSTRTGSEACGVASSTTGTYTGNSVITGYVDTNGVHGAQVNIEAT